jgi:hypothetical protein
MANTNGPLDLSQYISGTTDQAYKNWQNQQDQMNWAKSQFAGNKATSDTVVNRALDTSGKFTGYSDADRALYDQTYVPAMKQQMDFAENYTTPERMAANRAAAGATSNIAFDANADAAKRQLQGYDVDPSSGRFAGLDAGLATARAKQAAGAMTKSDRDTETLGQQYLANAIATGAVLPGQAGNEAGIGIAAGNQAVNTGLATTASGAATMGTPLQWDAQGNDMYKQWANAAALQTNAGLTANRDIAAESLAQQKLDQSSSSGIGATIGAASGLLGGVGKMAGGFGSLSGMFGGGGGSGGATATGSVGSGVGGSYSTADATGMAAGLYSEEGGMVPKMAKGGIAHDLLGLAGSAVGNFFLPVVGGMAGKTAGNFVGDLIEGDPGNVGDDAERNFTFGMADPDTPGGFNPSGLTSAGGAAASYFAADGGSIDKMSNMVTPEQSPSRGAETDDVHALLNEGEFVMPKDVASWYGEKYLQGLIEKARREAAGPKAEPEQAPMPQAMAMSPPAFMSEGARGAA